MIRRPPRSPLFPSTTLSRPPPFPQEPQVSSRLLGAPRRFPRAASLLATPRGSKSCSPLPAPVWLFQIDPPQLLDARQRQPQPRPARVHGHVPHHGARRGDLDRLRALGARVERHHLVRARLVVPDPPIGAGGDAVRLAPVAARARKVAHLPRGGIEPAPPAAGTVRGPHH